MQARTDAPVNAVDLSSVIGLITMGLLTCNILLGLLLSTKYNTVRNWPHRRLPVFQIHNWTGYIALSCALLHPTILLASSTAGFRWFDVLYPVHSPHQTLYNNLGALALYLLIFVVVTSYFRPQLGNRRWKPLHYTAYACAALFYTHGLLIDPNLKDQPTDWLDGEKLLVEGCIFITVVAIAVRVRFGQRKRSTV